MSFLADMGVSTSTVEVLRRNGHDAVHLRDQQLQRLSDAGIVEKAKAKARIIVTFDLDFGDLLAAGGLALPSVIIFRLRSARPQYVTDLLVRVLEQHGPILEEGAVMVVAEGHVRVRRLPLQPPEQPRA